MQVYSDEKKKIGILDGYKERIITTTLSSGDKELAFLYPIDGEMAHELKTECYIRTKEDEFVLKMIEAQGKYKKYTASLNVEELEGECFPYGFESQTQTIRACLEFAFEETGWKIGTCKVTKRRTIDEENSVTAWDVLRRCLKTYRCECTINSLAKTIDIYEEVGNDKGSYFIEGLNLRKLTTQEDSYDFYTRIIPIGKDGITIEWLGKPYIENYQYSKKVKTYTWKDERYTNTTSLIEDATAKLEEMSKPYEAYDASVIDLAKANQEYDALAFEIGDTISLVSKKNKKKEKQRIVKIVEYPERPEKNSVELANTKKTFAEVQEDDAERARLEAISISNKTTKKLLGDYSTTEEIETRITASKEAIELGVLHSLESYYDKTQTNALINITKGEIELAVTEYYQTKAAMGDYSKTEETRAAIAIARASIELEVSKTYQAQSDMKNYSTTTEMNAAIRIRTDAITSEVNRKVNGSEFGTLITQNAYNVRVAWNNNSKYVQFENGAIALYDGEVTASKRRAVFDERGNHFYRDNYYVGKIGTNEMASNAAQKGLVFDLEDRAAYMAWCNRENANASVYTMKWAYASKKVNDYTANRLHAGCDIDMHNYTLRNVNFEGGGINGTLVFVQPIRMHTDGRLAEWSSGARLQFRNGILIAGTWYS